ncbi:hypothetical protein HPB52_022947 [Rhipicephalus sanguineus]|uniref:Uncharacterized protein n=1 Tax=Rhipicephalus sanguineus TaxID=34632 RepID=A0A9D4PNJ0_RHISA|nr:hypothetical protein HPB52_022947 [Rhipicephalus sanguineus]
MASFREGLRALFLETFVFIWCNTVRLLFWLRYLWSTPHRAPPVKNELLLKSAVRLAAEIREGKDSWDGGSRRRRRKRRAWSARRAVWSGGIAASWSGSAVDVSEMSSTVSKSSDP